MIKNDIQVLTEVADKETKQLNHIIGSARTIQTAVLVVEYLRKRFPKVSEGLIKYRFKDPTPSNGFWSSEIIVTTYRFEYDDNQLTQMVEVCRAFVAGAGEIWT